MPPRSSSAQNAAQAKAVARRRRVPAPDAQDGAIGAGGTSALVVIAKYVFGQNVPLELVAALAPFLSWGFSYAVAGAKHWHRNWRAARVERDYERDYEDFMRDPSIPEALKEEARARRQTRRLQRLTETEQVIMLWHTQRMASLSVSSSDG